MAWDHVFILLGPRLLSLFHLVVVVTSEQERMWQSTKLALRVSAWNDVSVSLTFH